MGKNRIAYYNRLKAQGRCVRCGKADDKTKAGRAHCAACCEKLLESSLKRVERLKSEQRCIVCGKQDKRTLSGKVECFDCAVKGSQQYRKRCEGRQERGGVNYGTTQSAGKGI